MKERYENLDGIRAFATIGIVLMHVGANGDFKIHSCIYDSIIPSFTNFVFLFMTISAFSMCCGYYEKFLSGTIDLEKFYIRRYQRVWPFFAILCTLELFIDCSIVSLYEWFADITLVFGLIPNHKIEVVGVGWFLGVIFVFYMLFPFFVFLIGNKKRAWFVFIITIILNVLCYLKFEYASNRTNIIFCSMFFLSGGLIYLYRNQLKKKWGGIIAIFITLFVTVFYYVINDSVYTMLIVFSLLLIVGISNDGVIIKAFFCNKLVRFISSISMEIYLCHMFVYRTIEKFNLIHITGHEIINYSLSCVMTICGSVCFSFVLKRIIELFVIKRQNWRKMHENING